MKEPISAGETSAPGSEPVSAACLPWLRLAGAFLAGVPFFLTLPYTVYSWRFSPMDRLNWIFHVIFLLVAACGFPAVKDSVVRSKLDFFALPAVAASAVVYAVGVLKQIYLIRILGGVAFWWTGIWFSCGWAAAWVLLPAFGALALGSTSTTFLLCNRFLITPTVAFVCKLGGAVLCAAFCAVLILTEFVMKREVFWFLLAAGAILTGTVVSRGGVASAAPFRPDFSAAPEGIQVREMALSESSRRFYEGSEVHQYNLSDGFFDYSALMVRCGSDIHKIHPASHCLRSSGAEILSESVVMLSLPDGRELPVTEIHSRVRGLPVLTFVWYTGPRETTGSFFTFRRKWSPSEDWRSYQFAVSSAGGDDAARKVLLEVLSKF